MTTLVDLLRDMLNEYEKLRIEGNDNLDTIDTLIFELIETLKKRYIGDI